MTYWNIGAFTKTWIYIINSSLDNPDKPAREEGMATRASGHYEFKTGQRIDSMGPICIARLIWW